MELILNALQTQKICPRKLRLLDNRRYDQILHAFCINPFFARRAEASGLIRPAILTCCVTIEAVFFYTNQRDEDEYVISLPPETRITGRAVQPGRWP